MSGGGSVWFVGPVRAREGGEDGEITLVSALSRSE